VNRLGLGSGCVSAVLALAAGGAAIRWPGGAAAWIGWVACTVLVWGTVMSVYACDRPAPTGAPRP
jgi:hypothetical protein